MAASPGQSLCGLHRAGRTWAVIIAATGILLAGVASGPDPAHATSGRATHAVMSSARHPGMAASR
jgi:hypothetical protein